MIDEPGGCIAGNSCEECNPPTEGHGLAPNRRPWRYPRGDWSGRLPSIGGDEWCRWTLVIPTLLFGTFVIPLWTCRGCEDCDEHCGEEGPPVPPQGEGGGAFFCSAPLSHQPGYRMETEGEPMTYQHSIVRTDYHVMVKSEALATLRAENDRLRARIVAARAECYAAIEANRPPNVTNSEVIWLADAVLAALREDR